MYKPTNWEEIRTPSERAKLVAGGYVIKVRSAEIKKSVSGYEYLDLQFDIAEGPHTGYYSDDFKQQDFGTKKWKGHFRCGTPQPESVDPEQYRARFFKGMTTAFEKSNPGYTWDWDEQSLVDKIAGCIYRDEEYKFNGFNGFSARPYRMTDAEKIRKADYTIPEAKYLDKQKGSPSQEAKPAQTDQIPAGFEAIDDDDIPF